MSERLRNGTCNLCGEENIDLFACDELPEEFEGIACAACGDVHIQQAEKKRMREHEKWLDRVDSALHDRPEH